MENTPLPIANDLLAALTQFAYQRLQQQLESVTLSFGDVLYQTGERVEYVYFPNDCLVSLLAVVDQRDALEVGLVGHEGMVGVSFALGVPVSPLRAMVQGAGTALRMKATLFAKELRVNASLREQVNLYTHVLMLQISQTAACNRFHGVTARLARWLLMTRDRVGTNHFHLTQNFLAQMLGVDRVGVTKSAHALKQQHLIDYSRGDIDITDELGLEAVACSCYARGRVSVDQAALGDPEPDMACLALCSTPNRPDAKSAR